MMLFVLETKSIEKPILTVQIFEFSLFFRLTRKDVDALWLSFIQIQKYSPNNMHSIAVKTAVPIQNVFPNFR